MKTLKFRPLSTTSTPILLRDVTSANVQFYFVIHLSSIVPFFASTRPIRSGVGATDGPEIGPDESGQVFETILLKLNLNKLKNK